MTLNSCAHPSMHCILVTPGDHQTLGERLGLLSANREIPIPNLSIRIAIPQSFYQQGHRALCNCIIHHQSALIAEASSLHLQTSSYRLFESHHSPSITPTHPPLHGHPHQHGLRTSTERPHMDLRRHDPSRPPHRPLRLECRPCTTLRQYPRG